jgi:hypothetical protein
MAEEAVNAWYVVLTVWLVVMIILLGVLALTLDRYNDVLRVLTWTAIGWFMLGTILLGYSGEHL